MSYSNETTHEINSVPGRMLPRHVRPDAPHLFSAQKWVSERRKVKGYGAGAEIQVEIRFDDLCKNGHATFAVTCGITAPSRGGRADIGGGAAHDDIAKAFPELAHLIRWHLCSTDGPMHYVANTVYFAGDRDHNGLRAGESRQIINGRTKLPCWTLEAVNAPGVRISSTKTGDEYRDNATVPLFILNKDFDGQAGELPPVPALQWVPLMQRGKGKARDLDGARRAAIWPNATDEDLMADPAELRAKLEDRLPVLLGVFRAEMAAAGLLWSPTE